MTVSPVNANRALKNGEIDSEEIEILKTKVLPILFKGLCDHYVMLAELIVQKTPNIDHDDINRWVSMNRIKTKWQEEQFKNLVEASLSANQYTANKANPADAPKARAAD